ncbi:uncharacterized protein LOC121749510 [Salvia splendens]|uniref:uncharacterized protein LOC121749510 n=1 Tax=Salvia splendens TaxID=180675 RepID=UPI001C278CBB|nr:uncharacterized protein LOC121749510 [Salvia splendens]
MPPLMGKELVIFMFVEIEKFTRRGCIGNVTGICLPDGFGDDLIIEVHDSKGKYCGHARVQVADISDESGNKHCQCFISREPEQEKAGKNTAIHQTIQPLQMKVVARYADEYSYKIYADVYSSCLTPISYKIKIPSFGESGMTNYVLCLVHLHV